MQLTTTFVGDQLHSRLKPCRTVTGRVVDHGDYRKIHPMVAGSRIIIFRY